MKCDDHQNYFNILIAQHPMYGQDKRKLYSMCDLVLNKTISALILFTYANKILYVLVMPGEPYRDKEQWFNICPHTS